MALLFTLRVGPEGAMELRNIAFSGLEA